MPDHARLTPRPAAVLHRGAMLVLMVIGVGLCGCASQQAELSADPEQRNRQLSEGYALLYDLLSENRRVDQATIIPFRSVSEPTGALLSDIAEASGDAADQLEDLAEASQEIDLADDGLPTMETAARDAIASSTRSSLLSGDRDRFEKRLLLSQVEATRYAAHLAGQLAEAEEHGARRAFLRDVRQRFEQLHERVVERLTVVE